MMPRIPREIIDRKLLKANGVFGLYPAASVGDDVRVFSERNRKELRSVFRFLRNQEPKEKGNPNLSLSDFIAPNPRAFRTI